MKKRKKMIILDTLLTPGWLANVKERNDKVIDVLYSCKTKEQLNNAFEWALKVAVYPSTDNWIDSIYRDRIKVVV